MFPVVARLHNPIWVFARSCSEFDSLKLPFHPCRILARVSLPVATIFNNEDPHQAGIVARMGNGGHKLSEAIGAGAG